VDPILLRPGEGETITDRAERTIRILLAHEYGDMTWTRYEPGERGPDPHVHHEHTDSFYVLEGEIEVGLGPDAEPVTLGAGSFVSIPPDVVHTFRTAGEARLVFLNVHSPSCGFADYLRGRNAGFDQHDPPADGGRDPDEATVTRTGKGERFVRPNRTLVIAGDPGPLSLLEIEFDSTFEVPPHTHDDQVDSFYVLDGAVEFHAGGAWIPNEPGTFASAPPGVVHGFRCGGERAVVVNLHLPDAGFADSIRNA
jgi:quercetin dioxygenase-like cupin family protein